MSEIESEDFEVTKDTLRYRAVVPKPYDAIALEAKFSDKAVTGKQGLTSTMLIDDTANSGRSAYATKTILGKWHLNLSLGDDEDKKIDLDRFSSVKDVKKAAAKHLAASVLEIGQMMQQAKEHLLKQVDIVEVQVGETNRVIGGEFNMESGAETEGMIIEAEIPMPSEYQAIFDRFIDSVHNNQNGRIKAGDHVSGYVIAQQEDGGKWKALGQGDLDYKRTFGSDTDENEIVRQICEDMASLEMNDETILNHIRRHGISGDELKSIEMNGQSFDVASPQSEM